jgi:membrane protease YdiL (CAAX protease family)
LSSTTIRSESVTHLRAFFSLAYLLTWVLLAPWFYLYSVVLNHSIPWWLWLLAPFAYLGGVAPSVAGLVITARTEGRDAVRRLVRSLVNGRLPFRWYVFTLVLPLAVTALSIGLVEHDPTAWRRFAFGSVLRNMPVAYALALPFGPLGEELGWRGYALPRLLARFGPVAATLIIGVIWTFWHVPMMLWMPGASIPDFMGLTTFSVAVYLGQITAISAVITLIYLRTGGSVLMAVVAHLAFNTAGSVVFAGFPPFSPERIRQIYLVKVTMLGLVGFACLLWASRGTADRRPNKHLQPSPAGETMSRRG